jgi:hypothetical protein
MFLISVPIDDTHTARFAPVADIGLGEWWQGREEATEEGPRSTKSPTDKIHPEATYRVNGMGTQPQDLMALETQGATADRTTERLATSDRGFELYRRILRREIERVQQGLDPVGVIRDPDQPPLDTYVAGWIDMVRKYPPVYTRA